MGKYKSLRLRQEAHNVIFTYTRNSKISLVDFFDLVAEAIINEEIERVIKIKVERDKWS